jgi:GT2 family glycosyltransferase
MNPGLISVSIVTWNSLKYLPDCLKYLRNQAQVAFEIIVVDNGSTDGALEYLRQQSDIRLIEMSRNTGFCAAHNRAIAASSGQYMLILNPDVFMTPMFLANMVKAIELDKKIGQVSGKLYRVSAPDEVGRSNIIDTTGLYFTPNQRHHDRGAGEVDTGQYERLEYIFGVSGAAVLYRREALEDAAILGEYFDEDFFAYREDADLSWRMQLMGWQALYTPRAIAYHVRTVRQNHSRREISARINMHSVRNRFLMRLKNETWRNGFRFALPVIKRDLLIIGYVLLVEHRSLPAFWQALKLFPRTLAKRRLIMRQKRVSDDYLAGWINYRAVAMPTLFVLE